MPLTLLSLWTSNPIHLYTQEVYQKTSCSSWYTSFYCTKLVTAWHSLSLWIVLTTTETTKTTESTGATADVTQWHKPLRPFLDFCILYDRQPPYFQGFVQKPDVIIIPWWHHGWHFHAPSPIQENHVFRSGKYGLRWRSLTKSNSLMTSLTYNLTHERFMALM